MKTINNWRYVITGVTAAALMSFGSLSIAEAPSTPDKGCLPEQHGFQHLGGHGRGEASIGHLAKALELTEEQKQALVARKDEQRATSREQRKQLHETQRALHKAVADKADDAEITRLANQVGDLTALQLVKRAKDRQFMLSILTEEQREKMVQLKAQRKSHWHKKSTDSRSL